MHMPHDLALNQQEPRPSNSAAGGALVRTTFLSTFENVREAISNASAALSGAGLSEEDLHSAQLALAEALNNVAEHAYDPEDPGEITLILRHGRAGLLVEIRDKGRAMPGGRPPAADTLPEGETRADLPEGGFGWYLIREIARDLIYDRRDGENFLIFRLALTKRD